MPDRVGDPAEGADPTGPDQVRTRQEFARELTSLRERSGLTVRQVAAKTGVYGAHSTIGDWFAGRGLPSISSRDLLVRVLQACGVDDAELVERWLRAWRRVRRGPGSRTRGPEPYRGLASFQPADAEWFFGRDSLTAELVGRLGDLRSAGGGVLVVVGASGSGKSSVLRAGVIPALAAGRLPGSERWRTVLFTPGSRPADELATRLGDGAGDAVERVVIVDQFEEVFTTCTDPSQRAAFVRAIHGVADDGAVVVLGLRADFYAQALRHADLVAAVRAGQVTVGPMSEAELREAITGPARKARLEVEDGLVELMLRDVMPRAGLGAGPHGTGVLPLLSHALYATWSQGRGHRLTIGDYREVGGIEGGVAATASNVYDALTLAERQLARRLFLSLVHVAPDTADTRRRVPVSELRTGARADAMEDVLDRFVAARLVTADADTVEISHEALLTAWPRLREWLDADRAGLVLARRLVEAASTWHHEGRDQAALYRGARLVAAQEWAEGPGLSTPPTPLVREFLRASVERAAAEERAVRRRTRRLRQLVAGLVVLFMLTAAAGVAAARSQRITRTQRDDALSAKVANEATALRAVNPALATQLSLAAYRLSPTAEARGGLLSAFATPYASRLLGNTNYVYAALFSPDGRTLATAGKDRTLRLWDVRHPHQPGTAAISTGHTGGILAAAFAPDGRTVATAGEDRTIRLWDVADSPRPHTIAVLTGHSDAIRGVSFSPDGRILASAGADGTARLWDVTDPRRAGPLSTLRHPAPAGGLSAAVFDPRGRILVTAGARNPIRLWDLTDPRNPRPAADLTGHTDRVLSAAFSPDGRTLATGAFDNTIRLWNVTDPTRHGRLATLTGHRNGVAALAFSPDGRMLASGGYDATARLWDVSDTSVLASSMELTGHVETIYSVAFSPDGRTLATGSRDNTARLWAIHGNVLTGNRGAVNTVAFSPDGHTLAAGSFQRARLWTGDTGSRTPRANLAAHTDGVNAVAFSPDGRTLATASLDFTARLWDVSAPSATAPLATLSGHTNNVFAVAFSPDGRTVATAGADATVWLWDVTNPRRPHVLTVLRGHTTPVYTAAFAADGRTLATGGPDAIVRLWDVTDPGGARVVAELAGHPNPVYTVAFSPDAHLMAVGGGDGTVRLWDVTSRERSAPLTVLTGHTNAVNMVAFSPDGRTAATASLDRTVRLWDVAEPDAPRLAAPLSGHTDQALAVAFSPDGHTLATGGLDATVRLWDTDIARVAAEVCALAYPRISPAEWNRYFPGLAYRPPCP